MPPTTKGTRAPSTRGGRPGKSGRGRAPARAGRLKPADPFDLIRLLARSQHEPRKAVAELVQNSLDARASHIVITRFRRRGAKCLSIWDDGTGVLPDRSRENALQYIATHIGHSRKRDLSVQERYKLLTQGKYGIGLLGFWSIGHALDIRSKVGAEPVAVLRLEEDSPRYEIHHDRRELDLERTWTEVVIGSLHDGSARQLSGRRLAGYLAEELRGQILRRDVDVRVVDRLARGRAQREFRVVPPRFRGVAISEPRRVSVRGFHTARIELYYVPQGFSSKGHVSLSAAGTTVVDDVAAVFELGDSPWASGRLVGYVDFPDLDVAPGSRRGFVPNDAAARLREALVELEPVLEGILDRFSEEQRKETDEALHRQLQKVFRDFGRRLPNYELFEVKTDEPSSGTDAGSGVPGERSEEPDAVDAEEGRDDDGANEPQGELLPPGPLDAVEIRPARPVVAANQSRRLRVVALDATSRRIRDGVSFRWEIVSGETRAKLSGSDESSPGDIVSGPAVVTVHAGATTGSVTVRVLGTRDGQLAWAEASVRIVDVDPLADDLGIPMPRAVHAPGESWRSRVTGQFWEYNSAHPDYLGAISDPKRKFRYMAALLAKELVLKRSMRPEISPSLEQMLEVVSWVERKLPS